jgi:hypothetical protein
MSGRIAGPDVHDEVELVPETLDRVGIPQAVVAVRVDPSELRPVQGCGLDPGVAGEVDVREVESNVTHGQHDAVSLLACGMVCATS